MSDEVLKIACHNCEQKFDVSMFKPFSRFNCPICDVELIVPKLFADYILEEHWGTGGMADVYRAIDPKLDREVAIKILKKEFTKSAVQRKILMQEAKTAAKINHKNVVPIYSLGSEDSQLYIVMQFMAGNSLAQFTGNKENHAEEMLDFLIQATAGLQFAYKSHGIIHHDVKPDNVLLDGKGNAKVGDFGIAQPQRGRSKSRSVADTTKYWGSAEYASPERIAHKNIDFRSDIYSLGVTTVHLLSGVKPAVPGGYLRPLDKLDPQLPRDLTDMIKKMLLKNPAKRPDYADIIKVFKKSCKKIKSV